MLHSCFIELINKEPPKAFHGKRKLTIISTCIASMSMTPSMDQWRPWYVLHLQTADPLETAVTPESPQWSNADLH